MNSSPSPKLHYLLPPPTAPGPDSRQLIAFYGPKPTPKPRKKPVDPNSPYAGGPRTTTNSAAIPPCTECGKRFSSWKALFGHMCCHPERTWRGINPPPQCRRPVPGPCPAQFSPDEYEVASSLLLLATSGPHSGGRGKKRAATEEEPPGHVGHTCGVCLRGFASGQALGGHMRCHWETSASASTSSSNYCSSILKDFELDLNFPPPPLEVKCGGDDGGGGGGGGALDLRLRM